MTAHFPDTETIRAALSLATLAPSVRNSQPWHWEVGSDSLHLYADTSRYRPMSDSDRRDMLLSCGAALHHCTTALAALGWYTKINRFPNPGNPNHLAALELQPLSPAEQDLVLAAAIPRRRTDRRNYTASPVPGRDIAVMGARAARAGVMLRQIDLMPKLSALVAASVRKHGNDGEYVSEINDWSGRRGSRTGLAGRNGSASDPAMPARKFGHPTLRQSEDSFEDNAVMLALGTLEDDDLARLRAGEATSLVLLSATAMGMATCPVTEPLGVPETRDAVRVDVFGSSGYPQMMLRIGWAFEHSTPLPSTPRRPLAEAVTGFEDGAVWAGVDLKHCTG